MSFRSLDAPSSPQEGFTKLEDGNLRLSRAESRSSRLYSDGSEGARSGGDLEWPLLSPKHEGATSPFVPPVRCECCAKGFGECSGSKHEGCVYKLHMLDAPSSSSFFFVFLGFTFVGMAPWLLVNSIFVEAVYFYQVQPEGADIMSNCTVAVQLANIFPLLVVIFRSTRPFTNRDYQAIIGFILSLSVVVSILLAFFWSESVTIFGYDQSIALYTLAVCAGTVGSLSNVTLWAFGSSYDTALISALSTGGGISSLVPAVLGLVQQPNGAMRFSVLTFFLLNTFLLILALLSFILLTVHPKARKFLRAKDSMIDQTCSQAQTKSEGMRSICTNIGRSNHRLVKILRANAFHIFNQFWISLLNFFLPGVLSYLFSSYPDNNTLLLWGTVLGMISGTMARFLTSIITSRSITIMTWLHTTLFLYLLKELVWSDFLWFKYNGYVLIAVLVCVNGFFGFNSTMIYQCASRHSDPRTADAVCRWIGFAEQAGAGLGALAGYWYVHGHR